MLRIDFFSDNKGIATFIALMIMLMLTIIGAAALKLADDEINIAGNEMSEAASFYAAEAGLEIASASLQAYYSDSCKAPTAMPAGSEVISSAVSVAYVTTDDGAATLKKLTTTSYAGLNAQVKSYTMSSIGTSLVDGSQIRLSQRFECALIPIFQFAIFYMHDLWAQPVFDMSIDGRTHVNGNMYLRNSGTNTSLDFLDKVTCGGDIYHGFPFGSGNGADVRFVDNGGNLVSMYQGGTWIDAGSSDWYDQALALWGGTVRDKSFGQQSLNLPIAGGNPRKIIERANAGNPDSYEDKATMKIIDGVPYSKIGGVWANINGLLPSGTVTRDATTTFYDSHEKKWVRNTQVDMDKLSGSGYFPSNGILYISDQTSPGGGTDLNGTSLVQGSEIDYPLTVVCENPMYVQGDFNTVNKKPVAAITDAMTFLSNNWDPSKSSLAYTDRQAAATTVNISFMTGDIEPAGTNYGGGLENLPRFLEDWNGREFKIRGSMIAGWRSLQADGTWRYIQASDAYYSAPTRNWGFDTDLNDPAKLPPGTPQVQVFQRTGWKQENLGYSTTPDTVIEGG